MNSWINEIALPLSFPWAFRGPSAVLAKWQSRDSIRWINMSFTREHSYEFLPQQSSTVFHRSSTGLLWCSNKSMISKARKSLNCLLDVFVDVDFVLHINNCLFIYIYIYIYIWVMSNTYVTWFAVKLISYDNPTQILRQCSHLYWKVKLKDIWAMESQPQSCGPWPLDIWKLPKSPLSSPRQLALRESYDNPTKIIRQKHELQVVIWDLALRAFPSGWQPAAWQQACDTNTTAT